MRKLTAHSKSIGTQKVLAKTAKRSNDNGTYYAVEFESVDNSSERSIQLAEFVNSNINGIYAARLAHTFEQPNQPEQLPGENKSNKAIEPREEGEDF